MRRENRNWPGKAVTPQSGVSLLEAETPEEVQVPLPLKQPFCPEAETTGPRLRGDHLLVAQDGMTIFVFFYQSHSSVFHKSCKKPPD